MSVQSSEQLFNPHEWANRLVGAVSGQDAGSPQHVPTGVPMLHSLWENCLRLHSV
jgi:hypothetical protein